MVYFPITYKNFSIENLDENERLVISKMHEFSIADLTYLAGLPDQHNKYFGYQRWALYVLSKKAEEGTHSEELYECGAVTRIVKSLDSEKDYVVKEALIAIINLTAHETSRLDACSCQVVEKLLKFLDNEKLVMIDLALLALLNIASDVETSRDILENDGHKKLLELYTKFMEKMSENKPKLLLTKILKILINMSETLSEENFEKMQMFIRPILKGSLFSFKIKEKVSLLYNLELLVILTEEEKFAEHFREAQAAKIFLTLLTKNPYSATISSILRIFVNLTNDDLFRSDFVSSGGIPVIVSHIIKFNETPEILMRSIWVLCNVARDEENLIPIFEEKALPLLFDCLYNKDAEIRTYSIATLANLAKNETVSKAIKELKGLELMSGMLKTAKNERMEGVILNFLSSMSWFPENDSFIIKLIPHIMDNYLTSKHESFQKSSLEIILHLADKEEHYAIYKKLGLINKIKEIFESGVPALQILCAQIFEIILKFLPSDESLLVESKLKKHLPLTESEDVKFYIQQALLKNGILDVPKFQNLQNFTPKKKKKDFCVPTFLSQPKAEQIMPRFTSISPQFEETKQETTIEQIEEKDIKNVEEEKTEVSVPVEVKPQEESKELLIKCVLDEEIRYIRINPKATSYDQLCSRIEEKFGSEDKLLIRYNDPENSEVSIIDDESVEIAFSQFPAGFTVILKKEVQKEEYLIPPAPEFDSVAALEITKSRLAGIKNSTSAEFNDELKERRVPKQMVPIFGKENSMNLLAELKNVLSNRKKK